MLPLSLLATRATESTVVVVAGVVLVPHSPKPVLVWESTDNHHNGVVVATSSVGARAGVRGSSASTAGVRALVEGAVIAIDALTALIGLNDAREQVVQDGVPGHAIEAVALGLGGRKDDAAAGTVVGRRRHGD